jgi:glyoxylase-like metal-dependent hydrolase (beta-lactamase superfamily II)
MSSASQSGNTPGHIRQFHIPTPFVIGEVNTYLIRDEKNVLIDCGPKTPAAYQSLIRQLDETGLAPGDIDEIWITHGHPDHFGLSARFRSEYGISLAAHPAEQKNLLKNSDNSRYGMYFSARGVPEPLIYEMEMQKKWHEVYFDEPEIDHWIDDGDILSTGAHQFTVHHLPGHSPGHLAFSDTSGNIFSGDVLLQRISSNAILSFDPVTGDRLNSLRQLRHSMRKLAGFRGTIFPGHGSPFTDPEDIVQIHMESQEMRYLRILDILSKVGGDLYQITRRELPEVDRPELSFFCLSEVSGYIDRAIREGFAATGTDSEGNVTVYGLKSGLRGTAC